MVKNLIYIFILSCSLYAKGEKDTYEANCVKCHDKLSLSIDKYFYRYLLKYSSEKDVKDAMFDYLKNPTIEKTIMSESLVKRFGIKKKTKLSDEKLEEALDAYWDRYKIFGKLK